MPFEPLQTDEKLDQPIKLGPDMDHMMLAGCFSFVSTAVLHYGLAVWPFLIFPTPYLLETLGRCALFGGVPALFVTAYGSRRFGVAAAAGSIGGAFSVAIFSYLRLEQFNMVRGNRDMPQPEFPSSWVWVIPLAWVLATLVTVLMSLRKDAE